MNADAILYIGGTGTISAACVRRSLALGHEVTVLNRGIGAPAAARRASASSIADVRDAAAVRAAIGDAEFDVVAEFLAFTPEHVAADLALFEGRCGQYVFISSASAYQKPPQRLPITESTPLRNPFWQYSRDKIACEDLLVEAYRERGFPITIVRPSHTYDERHDPDDRRVDRHRADAAGQAGRDPRRRHEPVDHHPQRRLRGRVHRAARQSGRDRRGVHDHRIARADRGTRSTAGSRMPRAWPSPTSCTSPPTRSPRSPPISVRGCSATRRTR